jgi:hypothetical protein
MASTNLTLANIAAPRNVKITFISIILSSHGHVSSGPAALEEGWGVSKWVESNRSKPEDMHAKGAAMTDFRPLAHSF